MEHQVQEAYLSAMGVSLWYPRFTLPNAPDLDWPVQQTSSQEQPLSESDVAQENLKEQSVVTPSSLSQLKSLMDDNDQVKEAAPTSIRSSEGIKTDTARASTTITDSPKKTEIVDPFGFLFFRYPLGLSVVVSVADSEPLSSVELRFLEAVISYLGVPTTSEFNHRVSWPLVKQSPQFSTREFFEDSMTALFQKQAIGFGVNSFLLFGQRLSNELSDLLLQLAPEGQTIEVVPSPELPELLTSSDAKRKLWKQLLPLKMT